MSKFLLLKKFFFSEKLFSRPALFCFRRAVPLLNTFIGHFLIARLGLHSGLALVKLTVDKVVMGRISVRVLPCFLSVSNISSMLCIYPLLCERCNIILAIDSVFKQTLEDRVLTENI